MGKSPVEKALADSIAQVLEQMFFAELLDETPPAPETTPQTAAMVDFEGGTSGRLTLALPYDTARALAADFLGLESPGDLSDDQIGAVVCELANMICGSLLSALEADRTPKPLAHGLRFRLQRTIVLPVWTESPPAAAGRCFGLGNGHLTVWREGGTEA